MYLLFSILVYRISMYALVFSLFVTNPTVYIPESVRFYYQYLDFMLYPYFIRLNYWDIELYRILIKYWIRYLSWVPSLFLCLLRLINPWGRGHQSSAVHPLEFIFLIVLISYIRFWKTCLAWNGIRVEFSGGFYIKSLKKSAAFVQSLWKSTTGQLQSVLVNCQSQHRHLQSEHQLISIHCYSHQELWKNCERTERRIKNCKEKKAKNEVRGEERGKRLRRGCFFSTRLMVKKMVVTLILFFIYSAKLQLITSTFRIFCSIPRNSEF